MTTESLSGKHRKFDSVKSRVLKEQHHLSPHEVALKMIEEGHDDAFVMSNTSLSFDEIRSLKKRRD